MLQLALYDSAVLQSSLALTSEDCMWRIGSCSDLCHAKCHDARGPGIGGFSLVEAYHHRQIYLYQSGLAGLQARSKVQRCTRPTVVASRPVCHAE